MEEEQWKWRWIVAEGGDGDEDESVATRWLEGARSAELGPLSEAARWKRGGGENLFIPVGSASK